MPKYNVNDLHKRTVELDDGLMEMHKRQEAHEQNFKDVKSTAIASMVIGSLALLITLVHLALS